MLRHALLGILNYHPMNGYEIKQFMDQSTSHFWYAKLSQIYTTLKALEQDGLLVSEVQPQEDRPDRRVYTITAAGQTALRAWLAEPLTQIDQTKEPLLLKLFFSAQLDKEAILAQLHIQRALYQRLLETHRSQTAALIKEAVEHQPHLKRDALLWESTRRLGELSTELYVRWLDETIAQIQEHF
ncbi:MAG: PadR family transcriptional regulator [Anaerolineaceae bacterium]|nr:PadR family transcriptional regulator [Anaerolineaceae bacterium]